MERNRLTEIVNRYFIAFENKDLEQISTMLAGDVILKDPVVGKVVGREPVLELYAGIFRGCATIRLEKVFLVVDEPADTVVGEVAFHIDQLRIEVADIIRFNVAGQIVSLTAYLDTGALLQPPRSV